MLALLLLAVVAMAYAYRSRREGAAPDPVPAPVTEGLGARPSDDPARRLVLPAQTVPRAQTLPSPTGMAAEDHARLASISEGLSRGRPRLPGDLDEALAILRRYPDTPGLADMVETLALAWVRNLSQQNRVDEAISVATEAATRQPSSAGPRLALLRIYLEQGRWSDAENAARYALRLAPNSAEGLEGLGVALFRLDRDREARDVLEKAVASGASALAPQLLERIKKEARDEHGMRETQWAHFSVRFDGDVHDDVAREVLTALDRDYAELSVVFGHETHAPIPVILFGRAEYLEATQAPEWSGGVFSHLDGRIRIPLRPGQGSVDRTLEGTLVHELTHAFVAEIAGGHAPRDLNEGLAQYMEGHRMDKLLSPSQMAALAEGRIGGVRGFYLAALGFVEYLYDQRGQGGINDLLDAMSTEDSVDAAYERVYGQNADALRAEAMQRIQRSYGS